MNPVSAELLVRNQRLVGLVVPRYIDWIFHTLLLLPKQASKQRVSLSVLDYA